MAHLGGQATRKILSPEERSANARAAAMARWERTFRGAEVSEAARQAVLARWARAKKRRESS